jgi:hypothetical protein
MDMEMETEMMDELSVAGAGEAVVTGLSGTVERLVAAAAALEQAAERLLSRRGEVVISAEEELEKRLGLAEVAIAALRATGVFAPDGVTHSATSRPGRKTLPLSMVNLLAKQGVTVDSVEAGALDAALTSLSIEQRIAVKAQLMRAGLLG